MEDLSVKKEKEEERPDFDHEKTEAEKVVGRKKKEVALVFHEGAASEARNPTDLKKESSDHEKSLNLPYLTKDKSLNLPYLTKVALMNAKESAPGGNHTTSIIPANLPIFLAGRMTAAHRIAKVAKVFNLIMNQ
jgi:hypothetical protein